MTELIYNVPIRSHTDEHLLTKIADGSFDEQSLSLAASHSPPSLAPIVGFPPKDATETSHPSPSQSYLPDWRTHSAPHHITTMPLEKKHQPPIPPFTHPPQPPSPISLRPSHQDTSQLPPPPYPSMGGVGFLELLLAMPFTKPGLACGHLVTRETCTRCARRFSQRWSGWNACALARSSNIRCQVRVLMVIRDMAVAGKPGASCTSKLG